MEIGAYLHEIIAVFFGRGCLFRIDGEQEDLNWPECRAGWYIVPRFLVVSCSLNDQMLEEN